MKHTPRLATYGVALAILTLSSAAQAYRDTPEHCSTQPLPPPAISHAMGFLLPPPFLHRLKLDEAQQDQVFALLHALAPRQRAVAKAAAAALKDLLKLSASGRYDAARAKQLADAHAQANAELVLLHVETDAKLRALLTAEQRASLDVEPAKPAETRRRYDAEDRGHECQGIGATPG